MKLRLSAHPRFLCDESILRRDTTVSSLLLFFRTLREDLLRLGRDVRRIRERKSFVPVSNELSVKFRTGLRLRRRDVYESMSSETGELPEKEEY